MDDFKIKKLSSSDLVCQSLQSQIASGKLKIGDRLPSENDMAAMFGVSRLTVRLAIQKLNAMGVLETRQGSGTYVTQFDFEKYLSDASLLYEQSEDMNDICEFRMMLEPKCAELAAKKATAEEFDELFRLSDEHRTAWADRSLPREEWFKKVAAADLAVHEQICRMSHNSFCIYSFSLAKDAIYKYIMFCLLRYNPDSSAEVDMSMRKDIHHEISLAIKNGDIKNAQELLVKMAGSYVDRGWSMAVLNTDAHVGGQNE